MSNTVLIGMILFFILQLIMVILSTMRTILTVNASTQVAMAINAFSYTLYSGIVKLISGQEMWFILSVTFVTNIIGVYVAKEIIKKMSKDKLWIFNATVNPSKVGDVNNVIDMLKSVNIKLLYNEVNDGYYSLQIFSNTQKESEMIVSILKNYNVKYYVTETK